MIGGISSLRWVYAVKNYKSTESQSENAFSWARTHLHTHAQTDGQPENVMPPALFVGLVVA